MPRDFGEITVIMLGTGTSHGVPMIGCDCPVCTSSDPRDRRSRASILVRFGGRSILVDTSPELRLQCVANRIANVDAVLFTHAHADHVAGMDDLRRFNWIRGSPLDCYATPATLTNIRRMFAYVFEDDPDYPSHKPALNLHELDGEPFELFGFCIVPVLIMHGSLPVLGFRFGDVAYCTDCNFIPDTSVALLGGLDVLILDALRTAPHPTHFTLEQAQAMASRIGARRTYFTHIAHALHHAQTNSTLPEGMALAYDGQVIVSRGENDVE